MPDPVEKAGLTVLLVVSGFKTGMGMMVLEGIEFKFADQFTIRRL